MYFSLSYADSDADADSDSDSYYLYYIYKVYAKDEKKFLADFAKAYVKLTENGCRSLEKGGWF